MRPSMRPTPRYLNASGIDAVVVHAGLPLDLPEWARDHPQALRVPNLSV